MEARGMEERGYDDYFSGTRLTATHGWMSGLNRVCYVEPHWGWAVLCAQHGRLPLRRCEGRGEFSSGIRGRVGVLCETLCASLTSVGLYSVCLSVWFHTHGFTHRAVCLSVVWLSG